MGVCRTWMWSMEMASEDERGEEREGMEKLERLKREKWIKINCRIDENKKKSGAGELWLGM